MVHKNEWNISNIKVEDIFHTYIIEILKDSKNNIISLSDLSILLNKRTKHINIMNHSKKKGITVYMKCIYGNIINFLDNFSIYMVIKTGSSIQVKLTDNSIMDYQSSNVSIINKYKEWTLIDEDEFIMV